MAIRKELKLNWQGTEYKCLITMSVIDRIEDELNLILMMEQTRKGDVRFAKVARLFAILLNEAGADVTTDEVYHGMFDGGAQLDDVVVLLSQVFTVIFPEPAKKPTPTATKKGSTATRGKKSTK
jgi:hypothetical protein